MIRWASMARWSWTMKTGVIGDRGWPRRGRRRGRVCLADLAEQQRAGVGGEPSAREIGDDGLGPEAGKVEGVAVTVCHSGGLAVWGSGRVLTQSYPREHAEVILL